MGLQLGLQLGPELAPGPRTRLQNLLERCLCLDVFLLEELNRIHFSNLLSEGKQREQMFAACRLLPRRGREEPRAATPLACSGWREVSFQGALDHCSPALLTPCRLSYANTVPCGGKKRSELWRGLAELCDTSLPQTTR